tara:strand:- start:1617 stop:2933 length:1317 start_codon:yes stop_codon:yes gene_type:complete
LIDEFRHRISELNISKDSKILLALSGGVDSVVLFNLLIKTKIKFSVAHCNFCLRGSSSDLDEEFAKNLCDIRNIKFYSKKFNTENYAKIKKISIQMSARDLRYSWFDELRIKYNYDYVMTAHHKNDSIETFLIKLVRGSGIFGLTGISNSQYIVRPLIYFEKEQLLNYAKKNKIKFREDLSNNDSKYVRNKIRNEIIPILKEINPSVVQSIGNTIERARKTSFIYSDYLKQKKSELIRKSDDVHIIEIDDLIKLKHYELILFEIISDFGFNDLKSVSRSLRSPSGREFFNENYYMVKDRSQLIISKKINKFLLYVSLETRSLFEKKIKFKIIDSKKMDSLIFNKNKKYLLLDFEKLEFPLTLRSWKKGDIFIPSGMKGKKKVSDYFIDNKFSLIEKKKAKLLVSGKNIIGIVGHRADDRYKLVQLTKKAYIVESHFEL